jgi:hypothetical protein
MKPPVRPLPLWLKWVYRVSGGLLVACSLVVLAFSLLALKILAGSKAGMLARSGMPLAEVLGRAVGAFLLLWLGIWLLRRSWGAPAPPVGIRAPELTEPGPAGVTPSRASRRPVAQHWHSCHVLAVRADARELWEFSTGSGGATITGRHRLALTQPLPSKTITKDWRALWQSKLNVAWLPTDQVFLRVVHLPKTEPSELQAMLELQIEKLSPLPANQIVWSFELLPQGAGETQTVIVIIAERTPVEEFLGNLEKDGYLADRLELPLLHQLADLDPEEGTTWVFVSPQDTKTLCLVAWWYGGQLKDVNLVQVPHEARGPALLIDHLTKVAWAGEIEGWLNAPPAWHLVADGPTLDVWEPALRAWTGDRLTSHPAPSAEAAATLCVRRTTSNTSRANLLPDDYRARYHQQFVDRLWMRGLGAVVVLYLVFVLAYLGWVQYLGHRRDMVQRQVSQLSYAYTNALQLKERVRVFQEQAQLKFAGLDCWRLTCELLPADLTLTRFNFQGGRDLFLEGTVPSSSQTNVIQFNDELRKVAISNTPLFVVKDKDPPRNITQQANSQTCRWDFRIDLNAAASE